MPLQFAVNPDTIILDGDLLESVTAFEEYVRNSIPSLDMVDSCIIAYGTGGDIAAFLFGFCRPNTVNKNVTYVFVAIDSENLLKTKDHRTAVNLIKGAGCRIDTYVTWIVTDRYVKIGR